MYNIKISDSTSPKQEGTKKEENFASGPRYSTTNKGDDTSFIYSSANIAKSSSRKSIDIPPNISRALKILYKNMMKKTSGYTIAAAIEPIVCGGRAP